MTVKIKSNERWYSTDPKKDYCFSRVINNRSNSFYFSSLFGPSKRIKAAITAAAAQLQCDIKWEGYLNKTVTITQKGTPQAKKVLFNLIRNITEKYANDFSTEYNAYNYFYQALLRAELLNRTGTGKRWITHSSLRNYITNPVLNRYLHKSKDVNITLLDYISLFTKKQINDIVRGELFKSTDEYGDRLGYLNIRIFESLFSIVKNEADAKLEEEISDLNIEAQPKTSSELISTIATKDTAPTTKSKPKTITKKPVAKKKATKKTTAKRKYTTRKRKTTKKTVSKKK